MADRALQLQQLHQHLDSLVNPRRTVERVRTGWDHNRHAIWTEHTVNHPPLLEALAQAMQPGSANSDGGRSVPGSRPPLSTDALDRAHAISRAVYSLAHMHDVLTTRGTSVQDRIRALAGIALVLDAESLEELCAYARAWVHWCETVTGETEPLYHPDAPCPACDRRHGLRVAVSEQRAYCAHCRQTWTPETIGILGSHVGRWTKERIGA